MRNTEYATLSLRSSVAYSVRFVKSILSLVGCSCRPSPGLWSSVAINNHNDSDEYGCGWKSAEHPRGVLALAPLCEAQPIAQSCFWIVRRNDDPMLCSVFIARASYFILVVDFK